MERIPDHPDIRRIERDGYAHAPVVACQCEDCGEDIYVGEDAYFVEDKWYCCWCMEKNHLMEVDK